MARAGNVSSAPFSVQMLPVGEGDVPGPELFWMSEIDSTVGTVVVSDAFFMYRNVERDHPIGISENIYEVLDAHGRARSVADHIVPLYDPEVFDRYPDGLVAPPA